MALDVHKPMDYRRGWRGEDAAKHLPPQLEITVCAACLTASCWQGEFYCDNYKSANTKQITIAAARALNRENPCQWLKDENVKDWLAKRCPVTVGCAQP